MRDDSTVSNRVTKEQLDLLFSQAKSAITGNLAGTGVVIAVLLAHEPIPIIFGWAALVWLSLIVRFWIASRYEKLQRTSSDVFFYGKTYSAFTLTSAALWGIVGTLPHPYDPAYEQIGVSIALAGVAASGAGTLTSIPRLPSFFILLIMVPLSVRFFVIGGYGYNIMGLMVVIYCHVLIQLARRNHEFILDTLRLRAENTKILHSLRESEGMFRSLTESSESAICIFQEEHIVYANPGAVRIIGYGVDELSSKKFWEFAHPEYQELVKARAIARQRGEYVPDHYEIEIVTKHGDCKWLRFSASRIEKDGRPAIVGTGIDITDYKNAELELKNSETQYRELVDNVNAIILRMNLDGTVSYFNEYAEDFFGFKAEEILGKHVVGTIVPQTESMTGRDLSLMIKDILIHPKAYEDNENENITKDGRRVVVRWANSVILNCEGEASGVLSIGTDITSQKKAEALLIKAKEEAELATRAKSDFLANMSHEIRTPMNAIIGFSHLGLEENSPEKLREYLARVHSSSTNLLGIINDILDFSKIEAGKLELENAPFQLKQLVHDIRDLMEASAEAKGLKLEVSLPGDLPENLLGDSLRLRQVMTNLISNAIKFTDRGMIQCVIKLESRQGDQVILHFSVKDSGIGMSQEALDKLFQPFMQADTSTTRKYGGTGLGLVICRQLVKMMGGEIDVTSHPGEGSTFSFTVKLRENQALQDKDDNSLQTEAGLQAITSLAGMRVLLVEDNKVNQMLAQAILKRVGVEVTIANHGREAVEMLAGHHNFDVVLMDIQMPEMDGHEATRVIRGELGLMQLPIVAMTAHALSEERQQCLEAGMNNVVTKPIDVKALYEVLSQYLNTSMAPKGQGDSVDSRP